MELGGEVATRAPECLASRTTSASWSISSARIRAGLSAAAEPFLAMGGGACRAPAAWWGARTEVESSEMSQSMSPAASASAWTCWRSTSHVPSADQRRCRSWTVLHGPYRSGRSRHCTPVRIRCDTPFTTCRWSRHPPQRPLLAGRSGSSRSHWASVRPPRLPVARSTNHGRGGRGSWSILSALASSSGCNRRLALNSSMPRSRPCES